MFINEIDAKIMHREEKEIADGSTTKISTSENRVVIALRKKLSGKFYKILYPYAKEAK